MQTLDPTTILGDMIEANPERARLFAAYRIDYCCGGDKTLAQACEEQGLEVDDLLAQLTELDAVSGDDEPVAFDSPTELIGYIVDHHHAYLHAELAPLGRLVAKVRRVHADAHPRLHEVAEAYHGLARELRSHLAQEEEWAFPALARVHEGVGTAKERESLLALLDELSREHDFAADQLRRVRELTDDYHVPEDACASYRDMLARLERLASDTHMHVHRENNVLFPLVRRQLQSEDSDD